MIPKFPYHPDPVATGSIIPSPDRCEACGQTRGYIYRGPFYAVAEVENLCPWCIESGAASSTFNGWFVDDAPLLDDGLPRSIIDEVCLRTPSYSGWQQEQWLTHCGDACEYHGDATSIELETASAATRAAWQATYDLTDREWRDAITNFPNSDNGFYKFVCRHCRLILFAWDMS